MTALADSAPARARAGRVALALAAAFATGKLLAASVVPVPASAWPVLLADDVAVAAAAGALAIVAPRALVVAVAAAAFGLQVLAMLAVQALGHPFLPSMLAGVDPAMGDSAAVHVTAANAARLALVVAVAAAGCAAGARLRVGGRVWLGVAALAAAVALVAPPRHAAHRNAVVAFVRGWLPRALPASDATATLRAHGHAAPDVTALGVAAVGLAAPGLAVPAGAAAGRSVVLVVLESAAARHVAPAPDGGPTPMPNLRELAAAGLDCSHAYAVYPESIEGQVAILCGLPPCPDAAPTDYAAHGRASLAHRLREHGYRSGLFHASRFGFLGMEHVLAPMGFDHLADAAVIGGDPTSSLGISEAATVDALLAWLDAQPAQAPVLACYLPIAGHHPYASPDGGPFPTDTMLGCYHNALHHADRALARLWRGLCARRPPEHWLLCVVGDHGQAFGEHAGNFGHSFELWEENVRVPLVFVAPGTELAGRVHAAPCSHLDVVPTLLRLLGHAPAAAAAPASSPAPVYAFTDWGELLVAARRGDWKLVHDVVAARDRLFDLAADPWERHDLAAREPGVAGELRRGALAFLRACRTPGP